MTSVAEVAAAAGEGGAPEPKTTGPNSGPAGEHVWVSAEQEARVVCTKLQELMPDLADTLAPVFDWLRQPQRVQREAHHRASEAKRELAAAVKAVAEQPGHIGELVDAQQRHDAAQAAVEPVRRARQECHRRASDTYGAMADQLFDRVQAEAAHVVHRVRALTPLPRKVWASPDPERTMLDAGRIADWSTLTECQVRWGELLRVAEMMRERVGATDDRLAHTAAPPLALTYRGWHQALDPAHQGLWKTLHRALRLAYAIESGFDPGVWRPEQVDDHRKGRKATFAERLRNRGAAVGP